MQLLTQKSYALLYRTLENNKVKWWSNLARFFWLQWIHLWKYL